MALPPTKTLTAYGFAWWTPADVKALRPTWTTTRCTAELLKLNRALQDAMVARGWEVLAASLPVDLTTGDMTVPPTIINN